MQRIQNRWIKKRAWLIGTFLLLAVVFLFSSIPALASGGPKSTRHLKPFASRISGQHSLAHTVTCSGNGCNGLDPYTTGCAASFYEVAGVATGTLRVELEYSSLCGTNWTQIYELNRRPGYLRGGVHRRAGVDGSTLDVAFQSRSFWWIDTDMVFAPHNLAIACGTNTDPTIPGPLYGICTNWY